MSSILPCFTFDKYCIENKQQTALMAREQRLHSAFFLPNGASVGGKVISLRHVPQRCGEGQAQERKVTFWYRAATMEQ